MDSTKFFHRAIALIAAGETAVGARLATEFGVSRSAVSSRLKKLIEQGVLTATGHGRGRRFALAKLSEVSAEYALAGLSEDRVWRDLAAGEVADLPENVRDIWHYGITEMVNNAIDHSASARVQVRIERDAWQMSCWVIDYGEGIFSKIQRALGLYDPRDSLIELAKGKFTTDPERHTGEGIFFSSKVFDCFQIRSRGLVFAHDDGLQNVIVEHENDEKPGTRVLMVLRHDCQRLLSSVMDEFAEPEEYSFSRTIVPVRLAAHEGEKLISRSQAKRLTFRFERFVNVVLDFQGVEEIGQAFADELFRVFGRRYPQTRLIAINTSPSVQRMVDRVLASQQN